MTDNSPAGSTGHSEPHIQNSKSSIQHSKLRFPFLTARQLQFLLRVVPPAVETERTFQIPAPVTVAQAILESASSAGWGSSPLFRLANNPFGIKFEHFGSSDPIVRPTKQKIDAGPEGQSVNGRIGPSSNQPFIGSPNSSAPTDYGYFDAQTWEIVNGRKTEMLAEFQRFPNLEEAFRCHALLLARSPRYAPAMKSLNAGLGASGTREENVPSDSWKQFAERLGPKTSPLDSEHCGYSTNPGYSAELIKLVELYRLDDPETMRFYATGKIDSNDGPSRQAVGGSS